jgi:hypothetical protein
MRAVFSETANELGKSAPYNVTAAPGGQLELPPADATVERAVFTPSTARGSYFRAVF